MQNSNVLIIIFVHPGQYLKLLKKKKILPLKFTGDLYDYTYFFGSIFNHPLSDRGLPLSKREGLEPISHSRLICQSQ